MKSLGLLLFTVVVSIAVPVEHQSTPSEHTEKVDVSANNPTIAKAEQTNNNGSKDAPIEHTVEKVEQQKVDNPVKAELVGCEKHARPVACILASDTAEFTLRFTNDMFIKKGILKKDTQADGETNAFTHCFWSAQLAQKFGHELALKMGQLPGTIGGGNPSAMDLANNAVGVEIGKTMSEEDLEKESSQACLEALRNEKLVFNNAGGEEQYEKKETVEEPKAEVPTSAKPTSPAKPSSDVAESQTASEMATKNILWNKFQENSKEWKACLKEFGARDCGVAKTQAEKTMKLANTFVSIQDGELDGFRQCDWVGTMSLQFGSKKAMRIAIIMSTEVDNLSNYAHGSLLAEKSKTGSDVAHACLDAIQTGDIMVHGSKKKVKLAGTSDELSAGKQTDQLPTRGQPENSVAQNGEQPVVGKQVEQSVEPEMKQTKAENQGKQSVEQKEHQ